MKKTKYIVLLLFFYSLLFVRLPFEIYSSGGLINLSDRITVNNEKPEGDFNLTFVKVQKANPALMIFSVFYKHSEIKPKEKEEKHSKRFDNLITDNSKTVATIAALKELDKEVGEISKKLFIYNINDSTKTTLKVGDELISINNKQLSNLTLAKEIIEHTTSNVIKIKVNRNNKTLTTESKLKVVDNKKMIGINILEIIDAPLNEEVKINLKKREVGPSGGFMMALAIYDAYLDESITKGKKVAGSGTIDEFGNVGEIGSIKYKLMGAKDVDLFFVPKNNYKEAKKEHEKHNYKFKLVKVNSLTDAIKYLENN